MSERAAWTMVTSVASVISRVTWANPVWMYLERVPRAFLEPAAVRGALRFDMLDAKTAFDEWERGRVFDAGQELRWEWGVGEFHVVYCGASPPEGLAEIALGSVEAHEASYFLWGQQVQAKDRGNLNLSPNESVFIELRIPRMLRYPAPITARRVRVCVRELLGADGALCYARWFGISEEVV